MTELIDLLCGNRDYAIINSKRYDRLELEDMNGYYPDQSDKELFDAQMIENLKDELIAYKKGSVHDMMIIKELTATNDVIKDRVKELESGLHRAWLILEAYEGDDVIWHLNDDIQNLLPKENQK